MYAGVVIGFDDMLYFVDESAGEVVVSVGVISGTLSDEVTIQLTQTSDSAAGQTLPLIIGSL